MKHSIKVLCIISLYFAPINYTVMAQENTTDQRVDSLLSLMTLEEKVGQMNQYNGFWDVTGPAPQGGNAATKYEHLKKGLVGSMLNVTGAEEVRKLQKLVVEETRLGIPLIFGYDVIHGHKTLAPIPLAESASWDLEAIKNSARIAATEASAVGLNWTFAPMVDISRDPRWGRVMEGGGEDPYLGAQIAKARVKGFQGDDLSQPNTIAACAKHFAAYGFAEAGKEYNTVDIGTSTLFNTVLPPFKAAVDAGVRTFMNGFNILNGIPVTGDTFLQRDILKGKWEFDGFVVSDWASIGEMAPHGFAKDLKHSAELGAKAGSDMDMESYAYVNHLVANVKEGKVDEKIIDDAVRRILRVKFELGLFDDPYRYCDEERENELLYHKDHQAGVLDIALKSLVLLKNEGDLLPLQKNQQKIAVIGELADDKNSPLGSWRLGSDNNTAVSVLEGLTGLGIDFKYSRGPKVFNKDANFLNEVEVNETDTSGMEEAVALAKESEVVLMVLGEHGFQSGEGRSRTKLGIPGLQLQLLKEVYKVNQNVVLILMNGRPLTIDWEGQNIPSILEAWQLGTQTGNAIAKTLFGENNPSGKLPMTFPRSVGQIPIYYNHFSTGRPNPEPNVFWSHYGDEKNEPLFPFGHGLSYTTFEYSNLEIDTADQKNVKVSVMVKNSGESDGEEVVQLYIHDKVASVTRPVKELKGFEKVSLAAGETKKITLVLTEAELGFYNHSYDFLVEPGEFGVLMGTNSQKGLTGTFTID
ncbi:beta-glucosidase BglX [Flagellimonas sp. HMM57]|uniref:beta-glucosidase BglX n=1 Tax=unclassified Flagellimonas TaxID=2644544 RepID=UPI0013D52729|nr:MULTISPECIES: beta-glucosidase BglX [unclassified Flagellimonas]UII75207.1 beta-glucosidase BglX [Flagellimonas sp. HMM57]